MSKHLLAGNESPVRDDTPASNASDEVFCVHPWMHLRLHGEGRAQVCCRYQASIAENGVPLSLHTHGFDAIWNAGEMRQIRRDMIEGRKVAGCHECYEEDRNGVVSMRRRDNEAWENGWLNEERLSIAALKAQTVAADYTLPTLPANIEIFTGSLCNLKCRMCHDGVSSRIATDRRAPHLGDRPVRRRPVSRRQRRGAPGERPAMVDTGSARAGHRARARSGAAD